MIHLITEYIIIVWNCNITIPRNCKNKFRKKADAKTVQNDNCVKKDKNGKCPPLPDSPKPTPKKVEKKDDKKAEAAKK